jgi:predicted nucleic acid-binding protein
MKKFLLDTSAMLALNFDEKGADRVAQLLEQGLRGIVKINACFITQYEFFYTVWKREGEVKARQTFAQLQTLPIEWVNQSPALLVAAAEIKAQHKLSAMDAWVAASAMQVGATLVHKDPEFNSLKLAQEVLPLKGG